MLKPHMGFSGDPDGGLFFFLFFLMMKEIFYNDVVNFLFKKYLKSLKKIHEKDKFKKKKMFLKLGSPREAVEPLTHLHHKVKPFNFH